MNTLTVLAQAGSSPGSRDPCPLPEPDVTMGSPTLGFLSATPSLWLQPGGGQKAVTAQITTALCPRGYISKTMRGSETLPGTLASIWRGARGIRALASGSCVGGGDRGAGPKMDSREKPEARWRRNRKGGPGPGSPCCPGARGDPRCSSICFCGPVSGLSPQPQAPSETLKTKCLRDSAVHSQVAAAMVGWASCSGVSVRSGHSELR